MQTDLVTEDSLPQILKKPGNILIVSSVIDKPWQPRVLRQQLQMSLDALELTRRESAVSNEGGMISYHTTSSRRLLSAMSLGGATKSSSSEITRERSTWTLSLTANDPYRVVSQRATSNGEMWANFVIRIGGRDRLEERSKWTKPDRGPLDIIGNDRSLDRCIPVVSF